MFLFFIQYIFIMFYNFYVDYAMPGHCILQYTISSCRLSKKYIYIVRTIRICKIFDFIWPSYVYTYMCVMIRPYAVYIDICSVKNWENWFLSHVATSIFCWDIAFWKFGRCTAWLDAEAHRNAWYAESRARSTRKKALTS